MTRAMVVGMMLLLGCGGASVSSDAPRPSISAEACMASGGTVVGDPGDGSVVYDPDYRCPNGGLPTATVPFGIEGGVCCVP